MIATVTAFSQTDDIIIRYKGDGKLVLTTGETINGKVEFLPSSPGKVEIIPEGQEKETRYKYDEVKDFTVGDKHYFSVKMKGGAVQVGNSTYFAQLITPEDARIKMYMFETQDLGVSKSYYASIPGDETAYALTDLKFTPFKKIIEYVKDCQTLVDKITAKEKGYSIPLTATDDMRKEVFMNISTTHYNCK
jgi:hypothetical protein